MALVRRFVIAFTLIATTLAVAPISHADAAGGGPRINPRTGLQVGYMPTHRQAAKVASMRTTSAPPPSPPQFQYWGGPVVTSAQVETVLWGGSATYLPEVAGDQGATDINTITSDMLGSEWAKGLSEYDTGSPAQHIGQGSVLGRTSITPSSGAASAATIDDSVIQTELASQIAANNLPAPTANTIYTLYFPYGTTICNAAMGSNVCSNNSFCAYHGATSATVNGVHVLYVVQPYPDDNYMSGCAFPTQSPLQAVEATTSHELSEAITDPLAALATVYGPPLGWYDQQNGEVADLCQTGSGPWTLNPDTVSYTGSQSETFQVQQYWSNHYNACAPAAPSAPRALRATPLAGGHVRLTWSAPADDRLAPVQGYSVFQVTPTNPRVLVASLRGTAMTTRSFPYGHGVTFFVEAWNNVSDGIYGDDSNKASVVPASTPSAVPWIRTLRGGTSPIVGWAAAPANYSAVTKYIVTGPGGTRYVSPANRSFTWTNLRRGRYLITVRAVNRLGNGVVRSFYLVN